MLRSTYHDIDSQAEPEGFKSQLPVWLSHQSEPTLVL